ncbi:hypothetical protein GCM10010191_86080 [Actinomadura vinacea]|uniref:Uncharacterized protein n=1 Tax=Actinomadura vinacea TaxID=115336 RepID=A0ABN3KAR7_9ACTN
MLEQGGVDLGEHVRGQLAEIDADDLGTDAAAYFADLELGQLDMPPEEERTVKNGTEEYGIRGTGVRPWADGRAVGGDGGVAGGRVSADRRRRRHGPGPRAAGG